MSALPELRGGQAHQSPRFTLMPLGIPRFRLGIRSERRNALDFRRCEACGFNLGLAWSMDTGPAASRPCLHAVGIQVTSHF
jgi:hypothetical protein